jgi:hypothetical protein
MPLLNPPQLNTSPLHDLEIIASQQDFCHVRISFVVNLAVQEFLQKSWATLIAQQASPLTAVLYKQNTDPRHKHAPSPNRPSAFANKPSTTANGQQFPRCSQNNHRNKDRAFQPG